jgi:hypothetical protein
MPGPDVRSTAAAHLEAVRRRLVTARAQASGPGIFVRLYRHSAAQTPDWRLLRQRQVPAAGRADLLRLTQLMLASVAQPQRLIKLEVYETPSPEAAQTLLVELLTSFQALPDALELGHEVGDAGIALPGDMARLFTRGNLVVTLASAGTERVAVGEAARSVDHFLTAPPVTSASSAKRKRRVAAEAAADEPAAVDTDAMVRYVSSKGPIRLQANGELTVEVGELPAAQVLDDRVDGWISPVPAIRGGQV